jgi:uncharacterized protein (UPF0335 family)
MSENIAADQLRLLIERIERLRDEKKGLGDDEKDVFLEAKSTGFDVKVMRKILTARARDPNDRATDLRDLCCGAGHAAWI